MIFFLLHADGASRGTRRYSSVNSIFIIKKKIYDKLSTRCRRDIPCEKQAFCLSRVPEALAYLFRDTDRK